MGISGWSRRSNRRDKTLCCQDIEQYSSGYMDNELAPSLSEQFKAHMDSCPDCNTFYATFRATVLTLRDLPRRSTPADLKKRIRSRLAAESGGGQGRPAT